MPRYFEAPSMNGNDRREERIRGTATPRFWTSGETRVVLERAHPVDKRVALAPVHLLACVVAAWAIVRPLLG
jgi:hypothetical protein